MQPFGSRAMGSVEVIARNQAQVNRVYNYTDSSANLTYKLSLDAGNSTTKAELHIYFSLDNAHLNIDLTAFLNFVSFFLLNFVSFFLHNLLKLVVVLSVCLCVYFLMFHSIFHFLLCVTSHS